MDLKIIKIDAVNELRNERYFNEAEIRRIVENDTIYSHKERIEKLTELVKKNVVLIESVKLMDIYFPEAAPKQELASEPNKANSPASETQAG